MPHSDDGDARRPAATVRRARAADAPVAARLLDAFNREFGEPTPGPGPLARRLRELLAGGDTIVLLAGEGPDGVAVVRLRCSLWSPGREAHLAELYVVPEHRGRGLGRALALAALAAARAAGADSVDLSTEETDVAARALYEALGFTNRGTAGGAASLYYERELG